MTVIEDVRHNEANGRGAFSVSESGALAFVSGAGTNDSSDRRVTIFDRNGKSARQIGAPGRYIGAYLSPDGRQAIVAEDTSAQSGVRVLSLMDMERGVPTRFTTGTDDERNPVWSPDGASVVFGSRRGASYGIYRRGAGGGATTDEPLFSSPEPVVPTGFSSDGSLLLITRGSNASQRVWVLPVKGDRKPIEAFPGSTVAAANAVFSHDDKWIAYTESSGPTDSAVYIRPYPADDRRVKVSPSSGRFPNWLPGAKGVVFRAQDDTLYSVEVRPDGRTLRVLDPVTLFRQPRAFVNNLQYSVDRNVEKFLMITRPDRAVVEPLQPTPVTVVVNFVQGLRQK